MPQATWGVDSVPAAQVKAVVVSEVHATVAAALVCAPSGTTHTWGIFHLCPFRWLAGPAYCGDGSNLTDRVNASSAWATPSLTVIVPVSTVSPVPAR